MDGTERDGPNCAAEPGTDEESATDGVGYSGRTVLNLTLSLDQWREVWRILNNDGPWHSHLQQIEESCRSNQLTMQFTVAQTWPMSATVRQFNPELAEEISRQMVAQTHWWDSAESTPESSQISREPTVCEWTL